MSIFESHDRRRSRICGRRLALFVAAALGSSALGAGPAFAQAESDTFSEERGSDWRGTITGAGNLRQCIKNQDDRLMFLKAIYDKLDPDDYPSAAISVMTVSELDKLTEARAREAGFTIDEDWDPAQIRSAALFTSRIESYDCTEWSTGKDFDVIVVEYEKSARKQARDQEAFNSYTKENGVFKLYAEENVAPQEVEPPPSQTPGYGAGGGTPRGGNARPTQATICERNPQAYSCQFGDPSDNVRPGAPVGTGRIARGAPDLPAYLVGARTPYEAERRAFGAYLNRYRAFLKAWDKNFLDYIFQLAGCGADANCQQRAASAAARRRAELKNESRAASEQLSWDVYKISEYFGLSEDWQKRTLKSAWKEAATAARLPER